MRVLVVAAAGCLALGGCASLGIDLDAGKMFSSTVDLGVTSEPAGAQARLSTGESCASTPCTLKAPAGAERYLVTVSRQGFIDQQAEAKWVVSGEAGDGVEPQRSLSPNPIAVVLEPVPPPPPPPKKKPPAKKPAPKPAPKPAQAAR